MLESFDFGNPDAAKVLTGKLATLKKYNGLRIYADYFEEGMARLRNRYLNVALDAVLHPVSQDVRRLTKEQQFKANNARPVEQGELTASEWLEKGLNTTDLTEKIRYYSEAICLKSDYADAYNNRGVARGDKGDLDGAIEDHNRSILLKPNESVFYNNRGIARRAIGDLDGAIEDYDKAILLKPDYANPYYGRGNVRAAKSDLDGAVKDYTEAIRLEPKHTLARLSLLGLMRILGRDSEIYEQEKLVRELIKNENEYNQACFESISGNADRAFELLRTAIKEKPFRKLVAQQDLDFNSIRDDPRFKEIVGK